MDDEWSNLPIDPNTGVPVISIGGSNPLPVQSAGDAKDAQAQPAFADVDVGSPTSAADVETGPLAKLFGLAGNERYQTWPEKLIRSAVTAPADALAGNISPEDEIPRALDMASLAGGGMLPMKAGEATLGSGMVRKFAEVKKAMEGDPNYVYHATNEERANQIADNGQLGTYKPSDFTDQNVWPDGSTNKRNYFTPTAKNTWQFAPEEGKPVLLRIAKGDHPFKQENGTPDLYSTKPVPAEKIQYLGDDGNWQSLLKSDTSDAAGVAALHQSQTAPVFYSAVENAVKDAKLNVGTADQWLGYLKNQPGVKQEELDWTLGDLPTDSKLTKADVQAHVDANKVQINDVTKGTVDLNIKPNEEEPHILEVYRSDDPTGEHSGMVGEIIKDQNSFTVNVPELPKRNFTTQAEAENFIKQNTDFGATTKFQSYQLPGGTNYQEKLLTLPDRTLKYTPNDVKLIGEGQQGMFKYWEIKTPDNVYHIPKMKAGSPVSSDEAIQYIINEKEPFQSDPNFTSSHWDEPNVLAHVRMNDRYVKGTGWSVENKTSKNARMFGSEQEAKDFLATLPDSLKGNVKVKEVPNGTSTKTLHLEEIQSDWHQKGRSEGYKITPEQKTQLENLDQKLMNGLDEKDIGNPDMAAVLKTAQEKGVLSAQEAKNYADWSKGENSSIPNAPFKSSWSDLALKRMIRHASENGYDAISWTPGEAQAARYDLSKHVDVIHYSPQTKELWAHKGSNRVLNETNVPPEKLADYIGKEPAKKILDEPPDKDFEKYGKEPVHTLSGLDLKIGGEGMKAFYDKMLVDKANNIAKKYGGRVELNKQVDGLTKNGINIHFLKLPQGLKDTAMQKGFPLFSGGFPITPVQGNPLDHSGLDENVSVDGKTIPINNKQDVPDLAGASNNSDTVNIDKSVPRYDPKFVLKNGELGDIHKYLAIHETKEVAKMREDTAAFAEKNGRQPNAEEMHKIYLNAHYGTATPAEHAAIIADGGNPKDYEDVLHGYEKKTENEKHSDVPADLYQKVYNHTQLRRMTLKPVSGNPLQ